jgi:hypothetical protein
MRAPSLGAILIAVVLLSPLYSQNPRGSLRGTVQDVTGARIPSATVELQAADSSLRRGSLGLLKNTQALGMTILFGQ